MLNHKEGSNSEYNKNAHYGNVSNRIKTAPVGCRQKRYIAVLHWKGKKNLAGLKAGQPGKLGYLKVFMVI